MVVIAKASLSEILFVGGIIIEIWHIYLVYINSLINCAHNNNIV